MAAPWQTYVAGFRTWKALGRSVDKGQHGYQILAPNRRLVRAAVGSDGTSRPLERGDTPAPGERLERRQVISGFRIEHVFAEQTSAADLPAPPAPTLPSGEAPEGLWETLTDQIRSLGYTVQLVSSAAELGGANWQTSWAAKRVEIRADMDEAARTRTAIHELAHCILHEPRTLAAYQDKPATTHGAKEVEAESVAFIVADAHHMPADDYSFPYVAAWAGPEGTAVVRAAMSRVAAAATQIITASTTEHTSGGRVLGVEWALAARRTSTTTTPRYADRQPPAATRAIEGHRMTTTPRTIGDTTLVAVVAGAAGVLAVLWGGAVVSALLSGHTAPHGELLTPLTAFAHAGDPSAAWGSASARPGRTGRPRPPSPSFPPA